MTATATDQRPRVLVAEKIGESGIDLLREHFDVELGAGVAAAQLVFAEAGVPVA